MHILPYIIGFIAQSCIHSCWLHPPFLDEPISVGQWAAEFPWRSYSRVCCWWNIPIYVYVVYIISISLLFEISPIGFACIFSRVNPHGPWFFLWISGIFSRALGRRDGVDAPSELQRLEMSLQPRGSHLVMLAMVFMDFFSMYKWW